MKLGANVGYFGLLGEVADELRFAQESERLGYDSLWVGEPYGNDAATVLAWFAGATTRIALGSSILAIPGRTAAMTAQTAATLDAISGGRLLLGLGTSGPQVSEGWHGVPFAKQLQRTREYVEVVRMALRRDVVRYDGETIQLPLPDGPGKALKLILRPLRSEIPIYLAALGPRNVRLCGEVADGWLPLWWAPEHAARLAEPLLEGQLAAGREENVAVVPNVMVRIDDDEQAARDLMRPALALYIGGMGSREQNFYNRLIASYGYEHLARTVQDLYLAGHKAEATALIPDALVDLVCLAGLACARPGQTRGVRGGGRRDADGDSRRSRKRGSAGAAEAACDRRRALSGDVMSDGYQTLRVTTGDDGCAIVTLDRPQRLNAIDSAMFSELDRVFAVLDADPTVRAIVLTGAGRGFCAGLDLEQATAIPAMGVSEMYAMQSAGARTLTRARELSTPVIAAVNGPASGGGLALALAADIRVASPEAFFNVAFVRLGLTGCDVGVSWLLPRVVGLGHASEMMLTGRRVHAEEAERIGLVNRVVPAQQLLGSVRETAALIADNSPFGVALTKEGLQLAVDAPSLQAAIAIENRNQVLASRTADMAEAVSAFVERRSPRFTGA